jgi:hypothetical protein
MKNHLNNAILISLVVALSSCVSTREKTASQDADNVPWANFIIQNQEDLKDQRLTARKAKSQDKTRLADDQGKMQYWANRIRMSRPIAYEGGLYGKVGSSPVFIASRQTIPNYDRLYWVMVKVLSEKYGCFIVKKSSVQNLVSVRCRDRRVVEFHRRQSGSWIMFYGKQFDQAGREIKVAQK